MRISLVIEADSVIGFLQQLAELQEIPVGTLPPAKAFAHVAKLAQEQGDENKEQRRKDGPDEQPPAPKPAAEPEKEPETPATGTPVPSEEEEQPAAAKAPVEAKKRRGRPAKAAAPAATPVGPEEATGVLQGSVAPVKTTGKAAIFTRDDLTAVFKEYVTKFGYAAAASDVSKLLQQNLGAGVRKSSDVSDDAIPQAIAIVKNAVVENPFSRKVEANG